jgi:hypothetical protein
MLKRSIATLLQSFPGARIWAMCILGILTNHTI